jgi:hypothetical protein
MKPLTILGVPEHIFVADIPGSKFSLPFSHFVDFGTIGNFEFKYNLKHLNQFMKCR